MMVSRVCLAVLIVVLLGSCGQDVQTIDVGREPQVGTPPDVNGNWQVEAISNYFPSAVLQFAVVQQSQGDPRIAIVGHVEGSCLAAQQVYLTGLVRSGVATLSAQLTDGQQVEMKVRLTDETMNGIYSVSGCDMGRLSGFKVKLAGTWLGDLIPESETRTPIEINLQEGGYSLYSTPRSMQLMGNAYVFDSTCDLGTASFGLETRSTGGEAYGTHLVLSLHFPASDGRYEHSLIIDAYANPSSTAIEGLYQIYTGPCNGQTGAVRLTRSPS